MEARDVIVIKTAGDTVRKWKQEGGQCPQRELKGSDGQANAQTRKESKIKRKTSVQQGEYEDQSKSRHYVTSVDSSFCLNLLGYTSNFWAKALDL